MLVFLLKTAVISCAGGPLRTMSLFHCCRPNCFMLCCSSLPYIINLYLSGLFGKWHTHVRTTVLRLFGFGPRQPGWAGTRRNIHPLTLIVVINHTYLLSPSTTIQGILPISLATKCVHVWCMVQVSYRIGEDGSVGVIYDGSTLTTTTSVTSSGDHHVLPVSRRLTPSPDASDHPRLSPDTHVNYQYLSSSVIAARAS